MLIRVRCPECSKRIKAPERLAGRAVNCPQCAARVMIPEGDAPEAVAPQPTPQAPPPPPLPVVYADIEEDDGDDSSNGPVDLNAPTRQAPPVAAEPPVTPPRPKKPTKRDEEDVRDLYEEPPPRKKGRRRDEKDEDWIGRPIKPRERPAGTTPALVTVLLIFVCGCAAGGAAWMSRPQPIKRTSVNRFGDPPSYLDENLFELSDARPDDGNRRGHMKCDYVINGGRLPGAGRLNVVRKFDGEEVRGRPGVPTMDKGSLPLGYFGGRPRVEEVHLEWTFSWGRKVRVSNTITVEVTEDAPPAGGPKVGSRER